MAKTASIPETEPKPRGRQRSHVCESSILSATMELLETKCLRDVTCDAIAQRAGVSKATLYKWWPNKNLVALDAFLSSMRRSVPTPDTGSALNDFTLELESVIRFYATPHGAMFRQFIAEGQSDPEFLALFRERFLRSRREEVRIIWERGVARGELREDIEVDLALDLIFGPMIYRHLVGHAPLDDLHAEALVAVAFRGLQKQPCPNDSVDPRKVPAELEPEKRPLAG
ncbi:TetR/AcrR family transcriptional regulator [Pendulispora albinea]|uniref:TetR/AcrR family transcriptional regulator n=1 Tax=Pendulispora albinea TaxID=2741071 RepID=A0ABZ2LVG9_9BACT